MMTDTTVETEPNPPTTYPLTGWEDDPAGPWYVAPELRASYARQTVTFAQATGQGVNEHAPTLLHGINCTWEIASVIGVPARVDWDSPLGGLLIQISAHTLRLRMAIDARQKAQRDAATAAATAKSTRPV